MDDSDDPMIMRLSGGNTQNTMFCFATLVIAVTLAAPGNLRARMAATRFSASGRLPASASGRPGGSAPGGVGDGVGTSVGTTFDPVAYGGDPTGRMDSTAAVQAALAAAHAVVDPGGFIGNGTSHGGAVIDLMGGQFAVSQTLWFGSGGGVRLTGGSLRATDNFTVGQPMIAVRGGGLEVRAPSSTLAVAYASIFREILFG